MTDPPNPRAGNRIAGPVAFVGLGMMGLPMASRLVEAGFAVRGSDLSAAAREAFRVKGGEAFASARDAAEGASILITMLPDGRIVREALFAPQGAAMMLSPGALVIDMSSSAPMQTRRLSEDLAAKGIALIHAPVSGSVRRALDGSLSIMAGGDAAEIDRVRPLLEGMGKSVFWTGPIGSGHAVKALNNYVSAAGLAAACGAAIVATKFGIDPEVLIDVLNASTGRNALFDGPYGEGCPHSRRFSRATRRRRGGNAGRGSALVQSVPSARHGRRPH